MKILKKKLIRIIKETLNINEAATGMGKAGIDEIERLGLSFRIRKAATDDYIIDLIRNKVVIGEFDLDAEHLQTCGYWQTHSDLTNPEDSHASGKIGPFCYDLLIELGTLLGAPVASSGEPSGIRADQIKAGQNAINLWIYYNKRRDDLTKNEFELCNSDELRKQSLEYIEAQKKMPYHERWGDYKKRQAYYMEKGPAMEEALLSSYQKQPIFLKELLRRRLLSGPEEILSLLITPQKPIKLPQEPKEIEINIGRPKMNQRWAQLHFGNEARFWDKEWQMEIVEYADGLFVSPNINAKNDTLLNNKKITTDTIIKTGDIIGVGRESKIVKTPFIVKSYKYNLNL